MVETMAPKDITSSNAQMLLMKNVKLCSRMSAQVHVPLAASLTAIERSEISENKTLGLAYGSKGQQERKRSQSRDNNYRS